MTDEGISIPPHGGRLSELVGLPPERETLKGEAASYPSLTLGGQPLLDLELLLSGAFSPLLGYLSQEEAARVRVEMRLSDGTPWPLPLTLAVSEPEAGGLVPGSDVALRDPTGLLLAVLHLEDRWSDEGTEFIHLGGRVMGLRLPVHYDFEDLRLTPAAMRARLAAAGFHDVAAYHVHDPISRAEHAAAWQAHQESGAHLLLHAFAGTEAVGVVDDFVRVRCHRLLQRLYPIGAASLALLPAPSLRTGTGGLLLRAVLAKNYGCRRLLVARGELPDAKWRPLFEEVGVELLAFDDVKAPQVYAGGGVSEERNLEAAFFPEVAEELRRASPPRHRQGFTVFFTGLSGSGKSTLANALLVRLRELTGRRVSLLDGDVVRLHLGKGLGFSREDRSTNVRRIGYVASEITRHGGIAICAPIAPYEADRQANRALIGREGGYVEVYVETPIEVCEARDVKGLYAQARSGRLSGFTGVDDPYEVPASPEVTCRTAEEEVQASVDRIVQYLYSVGFLRTEESPGN